MCKQQKGEGTEELPKLGGHVSRAFWCWKIYYIECVKRVSVETGKVSEKTKRGKHTTRHVEIFQMDYGGMLFDTPGFTSFDILEAEEDELQFLYPEIVKRQGNCKYDNCRHLKEPQCVIRDAVQAGEIHSSRYQSYVSQYMEIKERKKY